ncbi:MAG TPA: DUF3307 domain-containing protein [Terracidiphilus sp.]|jgi:hypothetical protein|nr:DUF3307 domain-containing protein [Terracidiphilus sp.]
MQPATMTLMALVLAHLLGDFPLQSHRLAAEKGQNFKLLAWHCILQYLLAWVCLLLFAPIAILSLRNQAIILAYIATHLGIDWLKSTLQRRRLLPHDAKIFLLDQCLHAVAILLAAMVLTRSDLHVFDLNLQVPPALKFRILSTAIIYVAVVFGGGYLIRFIIKGLDKGAFRQGSEPVENAGLYIGWIERFLVITAMAMQSPALVGLILAGKSIARFPEFKETRFAEYFLIGTLLSISLATLGGLLLLQLWYGSIAFK